MKTKIFYFMLLLVMYLPTIAQSKTPTKDSTNNCTAFYTYSTDSLQNQTYQFYGSATGTAPFQYQWDFGDGSSSFIQNPVHTFLNPGYYNVCLTIFSADSCSNNYCNSIAIDTTGNNNCTAFYSYSIDSLQSQSYHFYGTATGTAPFYYQWNFGDGTSSFIQNPVHTFSYPGYYNVCLTITSSDSCSNTYCNSILVDTIGNNNCTAFYTYLTDSLQNRTYQFLGSATGTAPFQYQWNFGDGGNANGQNPVHTFSYPGVYNVCLTIFSSDSCSNTFCNAVYVDSIPQGNCHAMFYSIKDSLNSQLYHFIDTSTGNIDNWSWDFGDGYQSTSINPSHEYAQNGTYYVCLTISSNDSNSVCTDTYCYNLEVGSLVNMFNLEGQVKADNFPVDEGLVSVYSVDSSYVLINTAIIDSSGHYYFMLPAGQYIVRAELSQNSIFYGQYAPTYYINSLNWQQATIINLDHNLVDVNIDLIRFDSIYTGIGSINGMLSVNNKNLITTSAEIILLNTSNQPVSCTKTNNNSFFSFNNLGLTDYKVYAEIPGYTSIPVPVTLSQNNPVASGLNLVICTSIHDFTKTLESAKVYPNPVVDVMTLETNMNNAQEVVCNIYNLMGVKIDSKTIRMDKGINSVLFDSKSWAKGIYILSITSADNEISETIKIIK